MQGLQPKGPRIHIGKEDRRVASMRRAISGGGGGGQKKSRNLKGEGYIYYSQGVTL